MSLEIWIAFALASAVLLAIPVPTAVLVGEMRRRFERPGTLKLINRTGGGFLIGPGMLTALARRAS
jgi:threonine/homoserine/homoserine lactone efflux protein